MKKVIPQSGVVYTNVYHERVWYNLLTYFMTVVLGPTWAQEQQDQLVTLQWRGLWDVISLQTSAVSMWYSYISIDIDRYFTKYLRYRSISIHPQLQPDRMVQRPSAAFTNTATCNKPPTKSVYFCLKYHFSLTVNTNFPYGKQQKTLIS